MSGDNKSSLDLSNLAAGLATDKKGNVPEKPLDKETAIKLLWKRGILSWKLDKVQKEIYDAYQGLAQKTLVVSASRRLGKSYCLCVIAIEACLQKPNTIVKYIAPTKQHVNLIIKPIIKSILEDCPKALRPVAKTAEKLYRFANGSEIQIAGTDGGHAESLRGGSSNLCIVDEAGFCDDLRYIVQSILIPTTTTTRGKIILSSTPPKSPDHEFVRYIEQAKYRKTFILKTIYDAVGERITPEIIQEIVEEYGGEQNSDFRREYLCEIIVDEESAVVPEFTKELQTSVIKEWKRPPFFDTYVAGDIGFKDLTVFLFGYYDFRAAKLIIEDEVVMSGKKMTTEALASAIKEKETKLWTEPMSGEQKPVYQRTCDNNLIVINDLYQLHQLWFMPTPKDDSEAALNNMKIMIKGGRIIIHPRCETLIRHLENAIWSKNRKTFARSIDHGHYDAIDALKYMVRNVIYSKNPYPSSYDYGNLESIFRIRPEEGKHDAFKNIFKITKK